MVTVLLTVSIIYNNLFMTGRGGRRKNGRSRRSRKRASGGGKGSLIHSSTSEVRSDSRASLKSIWTPIQILSVWVSSEPLHTTVLICQLSVLWCCSVVVQESPFPRLCIYICSIPIFEALANLCRLCTSFHSSYLDMILKASLIWKIENFSSLQWKIVKPEYSKRIFSREKK